MEEKPNLTEHLKKEIRLVINAIGQFDKIYKENLDQNEPNEYIKEILKIGIEGLDEILEELGKELSKEMEKK